MEQVRPGQSGKVQDQVQRLAKYSVFASVLLGALLLAQLYQLVPAWLFLSVLVGWAAYAIDALLIAKNKSYAYPVALILAALTLAVSLPQPEHYQLVGQGVSPAALTFIIGSILQVAVIGTITVHLILQRKTR